MTIKSKKKPLVALSLFWLGFMSLWDMSGQIVADSIPEEEPLDASRGFRYAGEQIRASMASAYNSMSLR